MAEVAVALRTQLTADSAVAALVSDRVQPLILDESGASSALGSLIVPAVTYQLIDSPALGESHDERTNPALARARYQLNCWAGDYDTALALGTAVRKALRGFVGLLGGTNRAAIPAVTNQLDDYDEVTQRFRRIVDVTVISQEDG